MQQLWETEEMLFGRTCEHCAFKFPAPIGEESCLIPAWEPPEGRSGCLAQIGRDTEIKGI